jgi:hypothetical protein
VLAVPRNPCPPRGPARAQVSPEREGPPGGKSLPTGGRLRQVVAAALLLTGLLGGELAAQTQRASPGSPTSSEPEQLLQAIRRSLLDAATGAPVRVVSSAWIDEQGMLHETSQWHSQLRVRGIRVLSYLDHGSEVDPAQTPARVQAFVDTTSRRMSLSAQECLDAARPWRMPARLETTSDTRLHGPDAAVGRLLVQQSRAWWSREAGHLGRWYGHAPTPRAGLHTGTSHGVAPGPSAYEQALIGSTPGPAGAVLRIHVAPSNTAMAAHLVFDDGDGRVLWRHSQPLPGSPGQAFAGASELAGLELALQRWRDALSSLAPCEFPRFDAHPSGDRNWSLPVGRESGFVAGQRVFIADRARIPDRLLEPESLGQTVLAEVTAVSTSEVSLRQIAGPQLKAGARWIAWPL